MANPHAPAMGTSEYSGMGSMKEKAKDLASTAADKGREVASGVADVASQAKHKVQEWASDAAEVAGRVKDKAGEWVSDAADTAKDLGQDLTNLIRRYPLPSLLVGFGLGFLLARVSR